MTHSPIRAGLRLLKQPDFAKLFSAYLISYAGNAMAPIAMAFGVLALTGSTRDAAFVIAAPTAAQVLVLLFGGVIADRTSRQRTIVVADTLAVISQLIIAGLFLSGQASVAALTVFMLVNGIAMALHLPASTGMIPQIVAPADLQAANALLGTARSASITLGAALAGILVAWLGAGWAIAIDALSFAIAALLIASLRPKPQALTEQATLIQDLILGWREFTRHQWLWTIVLQFSLVIAAFEGVLGLLGPAVARDTLGGPVAWGLIAASFGFGTLAGGIIALKMTIARPMLVASLSVLTFSFIPLALAVPLPVSLICFAASITGIGGQLFGVLWHTTLQQRIPSHLLSRVSAYDHLGSIILAPMGIILAGVLYETLGPRTTLLLSAATIILPTIAVLFVREVRELKRQHPLPED
ncbi:MFS transporter [Pseudomonadales bacterium]|nr:MFS transporter [Pseudomonadales bacterium]MDA9366105.1 MFS transporter [Pseudomonadales bacterium]